MPEAVELGVPPATLHAKLHAGEAVLRAGLRDEAVT